jgi:hypothetical protein
MKVRGLSLFGAELRRHPVMAASRLVGDYLTYVGMVAFWLVLLVTRRPLAWLERATGRPIRERLIGWIARLARG